MPKAIIYTAPECPHSKNLKTFLKEIGIDFEEKCILASPETSSELKEISSQIAVTTTVIEGELFIGYDKRAERRIKRKLGV
ncbi:MAG: glutaredoxin family protein [Candidatus Thorarchaeota archaeon]|nr:MAG: glutaredoxin family protein [Candidatus Thorarchaeota archaeon]